MESKTTAPKGFKERVRNFSDGMFRNYQIMKKRWEISSAEKKRASEISKLGNLVFRLHKSSELTLEKLEPQVQKIDHVERRIKILEEKLRDIIMRADLPRQLEAGPSQTATESPMKSVKDSEPKPAEKKPEIPEKKSTVSNKRPTVRTPAVKKAASDTPKADTPAVKTPGKKASGTESKRSKPAEKSVKESNPVKQSKSEKPDKPEKSGKPAAKATGSTGKTGADTAK